jgi:hypothetical protein
MKIRFEFLSETPGAVRFQEVAEDGTPLVSDADGANIGALYVRKAALKRVFGGKETPKKFSINVSA